MSMTYKPQRDRETEIQSNKVYSEFHALYPKISAPLFLCLSVVLACSILLLAGCAEQEAQFSGEEALAHVKAQCALGPRPVGSEANRKTGDYIAQELEKNGWQVEFQEFAHQGYILRNVIGKKGRGPLIILGAHFDTRPLADSDPQDRSQPVMGANDGASGVAVLLELARVLGAEATDQAEIWLVFFDGEDRGELDGWDWCVGSQYFADHLGAGEGQTNRRPEYVLIVDMVGDAKQGFYYEWTSALWVLEKVWKSAAAQGYDKYFVPEFRYSIYDDHTPFLGYGLPAAVLIDFDYEYWHTRHDTPDKVSAESLGRVGDSLERMLEEAPLATVGK